MASEQRFELHFSEGSPPELLRSSYCHHGQSSPLQRGQQDFDWGPGAIAFSLCFRDELGKNPVNTLANLLETDTWVKSFFDQDFPTRTRRIFAPRRGDHRKGKLGRPQTVRVNRKELPPEAVLINRGIKRLTKRQDLEGLAALLEEQWKVRSRKQPSGKVGISLPTKQVAEPKTPRSPHQRTSTTPPPLVFFQSLETIVPESKDAPATILPARQDFAKNSLHRSSLLTRIKARLAEKRIAVVCGIGASGKTTLAQQLGFEMKAKRESYFLDCGTYHDAAFETQVTLELTALARRRTLLILDNAHLHGEMLLRLVNQWKSARKGSQLLVLSRDHAPVSPALAIHAQLSSLLSRGFRMEAGEDDLLGVFRSIALRCAGIKDLPSDPPSDVLLHWRSLFAGDLLAFTTAVLERLPRMLRGEWDLKPEDARTLVLDRYLNPLEEGERQSLLRLSVLGQFELGVPSSFFPYQDFVQSQRNGIVRRITSGQKAGGEFRLVHPSFGRLLLDAAHVPPDEQLVRSEFLTKFPQRAHQLDLLERLSAKGWAWLLGSSLSPLYWALEEFPFERGDSSIDDALVLRADELVRSIWGTRFEILVAFLETAETKLPRTFTLLAETLRSPVNRRRAALLLLCNDDEEFGRQNLRSVVHPLAKLQLPRDTETKRLVDSIVAESLSQRFKDKWLALFPCRLGVQFFRDFPAYLQATSPRSKSKWFDTLLKEPAAVEVAESAFFQSGLSDIQGLAAAGRMINTELNHQSKSLFKRMMAGPAFRRSLAQWLALRRPGELELARFWGALGPLLSGEALSELQGLASVESRTAYPATGSKAGTEGLLDFQQSLELISKSGARRSRSRGALNQRLNCAFDRVIGELRVILGLATDATSVPGVRDEAILQQLDEWWKRCWSQLATALPARDLNQIEGQIRPDALAEILAATPPAIASN